MESVFKRNRILSLEEAKAQRMEPCHDTHRWGGIIPTVDSTVHKLQNSHLIGERCDCGALVYATEDLCGCGDNKYWKIYYEQ